MLLMRYLCDVFHETEVGVSVFYFRVSKSVNW